MAIEIGMGVGIRSNYENGVGVSNGIGDQEFGG